MSEIKVTVKILPIKNDTPQKREARQWLADWLYSLTLEQHKKNLAAENQEEAKEGR